MIPVSQVTALILAGGEGRRMGGVDKGLADYHGRPLVRHVIDALTPQVSGFVVSANRNADRYAAFGLPVVADGRCGFQGPLAGIEAGLRRVATPWALVVPCDLPKLPADLLFRLAAGIADGLAAASGGAVGVAAQAAVACSEGRRHAVLLCRREAGAVAGRLLDADERRFSALLSALKAVDVGFPPGPDGGSSFENFNTAAALGAGGVSGALRE